MRLSLRRVVTLKLSLLLALATLGACDVSNAPTLESMRPPTVDLAELVQAPMRASPLTSSACDLPLASTESRTRPTSATSDVAPPQVAPRNVKDVLRDAEVIALVEVEDRKSHAGTWGQAEVPILLTTWTVRVLEPALGCGVEDKLSFVLPGGRLGERGFSMSGVPTFAFGDRFLLILDEDRAGHPLVGDERALLRVVDNKVAVGGRPLTAIDEDGYHLGQSASRAEPLVPLGTSSTTAIGSDTGALSASEALSALVSLRTAP